MPRLCPDGCRSRLAPRGCGRVPHVSGIDGAVAVVTGATRGVGKNVADRLASRGATVVAVARSAERFRVDVRDPIQVERLARRVEEEFGPPTILINAAGIFGPLERFRDADPSAWVETMMVDTIGPYLTCRAFVGGMIDSGMGAHRQRLVGCIASPAGRHCQRVRDGEGGAQPPHPPSRRGPRGHRRDRECDPPRRRANGDVGGDP